MSNLKACKNPKSKVCIHRLGFGHKTAAQFVLYAAECKIGVSGPESFCLCYAAC